MTKTIVSTIFMVLAGCSSNTEPAGTQVTDSVTQGLQTTEVSTSTSETTNSSAVDVTVTAAPAGTSVVSSCADGSLPVDGVCPSVTSAQSATTVSH